MEPETVQQVVDVLQTLDISCLDLTGGAPELHPHFRTLVRAGRAKGVQVIDRCNLTILLERGFEDLATFLAKEKVNIVASLPCYEAESVDSQRGRGVFARSIRALQLLNNIGYGSQDDLKLDLVYNPLGPTLPPEQVGLEREFKHMLQTQFDIVFNRLYTITNMPINRFGATLLANNQLQDYMCLLKHHYQAENLDTVMCRETISVDWQGFLYACDFNQMLRLNVLDDNKPVHISNLLDTNFEMPKTIRTGEHCYGCTAGQGSSCTGALNGKLT